MAEASKPQFSLREVVGRSPGIDGAAVGLYVAARIPGFGGVAPLNQVGAPF
jgi:hypothetical protein